MGGCRTPGLTYEHCLKKIQLLSVASFCLLKKDVAFKQLSDTLRLPESQAEEVVVQAIGLGLLDAKVDQINRVVHVRCVTYGTVAVGSPCTCFW